MKPPFGWTGDAGALTPTVQGTLPPWLIGTLMRTAPAVYEVGDWKAGHWFDGLALLYAFELGANGAVGFKQRLLGSTAWQELSKGDKSRASFLTPMERGFFNRLFHPIPLTTDNTNVNVVPWEGQWLALTETAHQHVIDPATLETKGWYRFDDDLGRTTTSAHASLNPGVAKSMVNVGTEMSLQNALLIFRQDAGTHRRVVEGKVKVDRVPYVHSFGVSERYATLIDHPFTAHPRTMLWSNKGFIEHFDWRPERGARLHLLDRRTGTSRRFETDAFFCFHAINQFEDGDDVVLDFLAWKDPSIIPALKMELLAKGHPPISSKWVRARLKPGQTKVDLEPMSDVPFEFPVINLKHSLAKETRCVWGATIASSDEKESAHVLKLKRGEAVKKFSSPGWTHGEPVMVPRPGATEEDDGVLLAVACHDDGVRSALFVIDAAQLTEVARVELNVGLPLGFHGSFQLRA